MNDRERKRSRTPVNKNKSSDLFLAFLGPTVWVCLLSEYISTGTVEFAEAPRVDGWQAIVGLGLLFIICFGCPYLYLKNIWLQRRNARKESKDE